MPQYHVKVIRTYVATEETIITVDAADETAAEIKAEEIYDDLPANTLEWDDGDSEVTDVAFAAVVVDHA